MSYSLIGADRATHLKIVAVALIAGIVVVLVGIAARVSDFETASAMMADRPVIKAGQPAVLTTRETPNIR
jgi:hypothetical protein